MLAMLYNQQHLPLLGLCNLCCIKKARQRHHLIPKSVSHQYKFHKSYNMKVLVCRECHRFLHNNFSNKRLARELYSVERIRNHQTFANYLEKTYPNPQLQEMIGERWSLTAEELKWQPTVRQNNISHLFQI